MLKPIPAKILQTTATVAVCTGVDRYQKPTATEYTLTRVHLQPTDEIRKTKDNTEKQLRSILFVDARISRHAIDWLGLLESAHAAQGDIKITIRGTVYTVVSVDELRDDQDIIHHWEIGLG